MSLFDHQDRRHSKRQNVLQNSDTLNNIANETRDSSKYEISSKNNCIRHVDCQSVLLLIAVTAAMTKHWCYNKLHIKIT